MLQLKKWHCLMLLNGLFLHIKGIRADVFMIWLTFFISVQAAHQSGEDEVSLSTMGRAYTIDFNSMQQINEDTGTARSVQRKVNPFASIPTQPGSGKKKLR